MPAAITTIARLPRATLRTAAVIGTVLALVVTYVVVTVPTASAATLFTDDFEDGNSSGWTTSGGSWSVVTDGSRALRQSGTSSDARARNGSSTTLATAPVTVTVGTWYTLRLEVSGTTLRGTVNNGTTVTATDTRFSA